MYRGLYSSSTAPTPSRAKAKVTDICQYNTRNTYISLSKKLDDVHRNVKKMGFARNRYQKSLALVTKRIEDFSLCCIIFCFAGDDELLIRPGAEDNPYISGRR
jgi:hypothetical protein